MTRAVLPAGPGIRVDTARAGRDRPCRPTTTPCVAKLVVSGPDRAAALDRLAGRARPVRHRRASRPRSRSTVALVADPELRRRRGRHRLAGALPRGRRRRGGRRHPPREAGIGGAVAEVRLVDVSIRDGNQCLWSATGLRTRHILQVAPLLERVGFHALDYISSTFMGIAVRMHQEDPWERIRLTRAAAPDDPPPVHRDRASGSSPGRRRTPS